MRAFKFLGFKFEISSNIKIANFLDNNSYKPFLKTNQYPSNINVYSNHLSSLIKQVPKADNTRIRRLSLNKNIFHESCKMYFEAQGIVVLTKNLYKHKETTDNCNIKVNYHKNITRTII